MDKSSNRENLFLFGLGILILTACNMSELDRARLTIQLDPSQYPPESFSVNGFTWRYVGPNPDTEMSIFVCDYCDVSESLDGINISDIGSLRVESGLYPGVDSAIQAGLAENDIDAVMIMGDNYNVWSFEPEDLQVFAEETDN